MLLNWKISRKGSHCWTRAMSAKNRSWRVDIELLVNSCHAAQFKNYILAIQNFETFQKTPKR